MSFKELFEAKGPKVKKESLLNYNISYPLCREASREIEAICDLIEKEGYYLLKNVKTDREEAIISPEDLAKIPGATEALSNGERFKIGRSTYRNYRPIHIFKKAFKFVVEGDIVDKPAKNPMANEGLYYDAQVLHGIGLSTLTRDIAEARSHDDYFGAYFSATGTKVEMIGTKGTVKTNKNVFAHFQQNSSIDWKRFPPDSLVYKEVHISKLFPKAFKKSTIKKKDIFVIK